MDYQLKNLYSAFLLIEAKYPEHSMSFASSLVCVGGAGAELNFVIEKNREDNLRGTQMKSMSSPEHFPEGPESKAFPCVDVEGIKSWGERS